MVDSTLDVDSLFQYIIALFCSSHAAISSISEKYLDITMMSIAGHLNSSKTFLKRVLGYLRNRTGKSMFKTRNIYCGVHHLFIQPHTCLILNILGQHVLTKNLL
jgi:hypothetical protein